MPFLQQAAVVLQLAAVICISSQNDSVAKDFFLIRVVLRWPSLGLVLLGPSYLVVSKFLLNQWCHSKIIVSCLNCSSNQWTFLFKSLNSWNINPAGFLFLSLSFSDEKKIQPNESHLKEKKMTALHKWHLVQDLKLYPWIKTNLIPPWLHVNRCCPHSPLWHRH